MFKNLENNNMQSNTTKPVFITQDASMMTLYQNVKLVARSNAPAIITGESGTGKEVLARLLHFHSPRCNHPFVALNCGALPEDIVESELFGHEKGSFTGAVNRRKGCFEQADNGILFLDEIGETSQRIQVKLLRAVELKNFRRVGGSEETQTDVQIVTATNRDIAVMMNDGKFREDLYYRLSVIELNIPPLRDRRSDIPLLSEYFLSKFLQEHDLPEKYFSNEFLNHLMNYGWPGNVRELRNAIERCAIMCTDSEIHTDYLPKAICSSEPEMTGSKNLQNSSDHIAGTNGTNRCAFSESNSGGSNSRNNNTGDCEQLTIPIGTSMENAERMIIRQTLSYTDNNISEAARVLGVSRNTLHNKLSRFKI